MSSTVSFESEGPIGFIVINHPPINAISANVIADLGEALEEFESSLDLSALVIYCEGRTWVAGADMRMFDNPEFTAAPYNHLLQRLEEQKRPVVAALHGMVLGGGLELALACHARVARRDSSFAFPEVKLGLIPGSLGTQRLPRLVGGEFALDLCTSGRIIAAELANEKGLIDSLADGEPRAFGTAMAQALLAEGKPPRKTSMLEVVPASPESLQKAEAAAAKKSGWPQLAAVVRCVRAAQELPYGEGEKIEAKEFAALVHSPSSKALRHLFFAEREAAKIPDVPRDTRIKSVHKVGIVGAGTMGAGIALNFLNAGIDTVIVETDPDALQRGLRIIKDTLETSAAKGRITPEKVGGCLQLLQGTLSYSDLADCDLLIEAVFENLAVKQQVCAELGRVAKPGAIIATNTSTLDVNVLAAATGRPADVIGMHFFSPANIMRLLEVVRGTATSAEVLATVMKLAVAIGKVPVVSGICYGFIGNRMAEVYMRETEFLILEGAEPSQIDAAIEALGFAMGPCRMLDMAGIDVGAKTVIEHEKTGGLPSDPRYRVLVRKLFELGRYGVKTQAGYYKYEGRTAFADVDVRLIAESLAAQHNISRRKEISSKEITERLLFPLINEGFKILNEGIALRASDIDVVWVTGFGFPDFKGGPMWWAETVGLKFITERMAHYAEILGNEYGYWTTAKQLS